MEPVTMTVVSGVAGAGAVCGATFAEVVSPETSVPAAAGRTKRHMAIMTRVPACAAAVRAKRAIASLIVIGPCISPHPESTARILSDDRAR